MDQERGSIKRQNEMEPSLFGTDLFGDAVKPPAPKGKLADKFMLPPFSVLSAREGWWQERKRGWLALGIESEIGRAVSPGGSALPAADYKEGGRGDGRGRIINPTGRKEGLTFGKGKGIAQFDHYRVKEGKKAETSEQSTSIFDPVLCEVAYRWFCPEGGLVLDPFAGGSVRGIVAHLLNRRYWGCDLRPEQIESNEKQAAVICPPNKMTCHSCGHKKGLHDCLTSNPPKHKCSVTNCECTSNPEAKNPVWVCGDASDAVPALDEACDFIFSCPPYGDLEQYSDDPRDLSNMDHMNFSRLYNYIVEQSCLHLKANRFACFVVGNFRNKDTGIYRDFVGETVAAFREAGLGLYNEAVLVTMVASLSVRAEAQFTCSRKLGKTHQNLLIFVKGSPEKAAQACGEVKSI